ncbi:MAG: adenosine deaminase family protein [Longimicrobiales bacterium]
MPFRPSILSGRAFGAAAILLAASACARGPASPGAVVAGPQPSTAAAATSAVVDAEAAASRAFDAVRSDSARLYVFLFALPKGGDLHTHLSGAVYAESYLDWAAEDGLCIALETLTLVAPPCDAAAARPPAADVQRNSSLRDSVVDAFSMRNHKPAVESGHERFFATFDRFGAVSNTRVGEMLSETAARAARGQVRYLELMHTAGGMSVGSLGAAVGWDDDFARMRQKLLDAGLRDTLVAISRGMDADEATRDAALRCGTSTADPGCGVTQRYLYQVLRAFPTEMVFAQILAGFELAQRDRRFVGFNLVQPEDDRVAMGDYSLHMRIIAFLRELYPEVPVALHAGELAPGLVPPEGLRFHIHEAVGVAGARRIGHGVDVLYENDPDALLRLMAQRRVLVEINLTSNDVILGVTGARHPLRTYLAYRVPVALSTDDEGVSRSEMSLEYRKAVEEQGVDYRTLKAMARNSLEYAFVEGGALWADYDHLTPVEACGDAAGGLEGTSCRAYTAANEKARLQASLELDYRAFEARVAAGAWPWSAGLGK